MERFRMATWLVVAILSLTTLLQAQGKKNNSSPWITFEQSECYGTCPTYKLSIYSDGRFVYKGSKNVAITDAAAKITDNKLHILRSAVTAARISNMRGTYATEKDGCKSVLSDFSWITLTIKSNNNRKTVKHYLGCEIGNSRIQDDLKRLRKLESSITKLFAIDRFENGN